MCATAGFPVTSPSCSIARVRIAQSIYYGLDAFPQDATGRCMQLLHGLCCFDFVSDIPLSPSTLPHMKYQN